MIIFLEDLFYLIIPYISYPQEPFRFLDMVSLEKLYLSKRFQNPSVKSLISSFLFRSCKLELFNL